MEKCALWSDVWKSVALVATQPCECTELHRTVFFKWLVLLGDFS